MWRGFTGEREDLVEAFQQTAGEQRLISDGGAVVACGDGAKAALGYQHDRHRHTRQRTDTVLPQDVCPGKVGVARIEGNGAGLYVRGDDRTDRRL